MNIERYRGSLLGLAIGDALGSPLEGMKAGRVKDVYGTVSGYVNAEAAWAGKPYRYLPPGVYTDAAQQALCLSDSLIRCYGFNADDFGRTLMQLWQVDPALRFGVFRSPGPALKKAMEKLVVGVPLSKIGEPSAGLGAAVAAAPVGLYFSDDPEALLKAAIEQTLLTHKDPRAMALSAAIAFCVFSYASGNWDSLKTSGRVESLIEFVLQAEKAIEQEYIRELPPMVYDFFGFLFRSVEPFRHWQGMEHELVFRQIVNLANLAFPSHKIQSPSQDFALAAGVTALFLALVSPDFETGMVEAISLGRDADSLGAMLGAMLGARFGEAEIPKAWKAGLKNHDQVAARAEALYQKSFAGLEIKSLVKMELELTRSVNGEREKFIEKMIRKGEYDPLAAARKRGEKEKAETALLPAVKLKRKAKEGKPRREKTPWRTWEK